ncbi:putative ARM-like repeat-containing protein [Escovopsis weberi]|uniref:Putative ARM-like repeat-containing protein n=1 Tax=Escovopsis weberi TaxID=150374 RepID=A0A0M9VSV3_ESCWE|nr:putative ARM-like repeat-containing protein [Escovopsis weberi]
MGKSKRSKPGHRRDPVAKQVKPPSDPQLAALRESKILPIIKDLQSAEPKSRSAAASVISTIISDTRCRKLLLREQIVHTILTQTLTDAALESRAAGWGILQVLAQEEEADFCVHLFRQDILTAIEFASSAVAAIVLSPDTPFPRLPRAERGFTASIAASLLSLLTALAEAGDDILDVIVQNHTITRLLFALVAHINQDEEDLISPLRSDALTCLLLLSEDNAELAARLTSAGDAAACYRALTALIDEANGEAIVACAILHNIYAALFGRKDVPRPQVDVADDVDLIPRLVNAVSSFAPGQPPTAGVSGWSNPEEYQQLALETLASIGTSLAAELGGPAHSAPKSKKKGGKDTAAADDDEEMEDDDDDDDDAEPEGGEGNDDDDEEEEEEEEEEGGDNGEGDEGEDSPGEDHEMNEDEIEADMDMVTSGDHFTENIDDLPTLKALLQTAIPELARIASVQPGDELSLKLQSCALSALSNIAWSVSLVDFAEEVNAGVQRAWAPAARSLWQAVVSPVLASDTADVGLATQVTSLAWALARTLRGAPAPAPATLAPLEHRRFISLYHATRGAPATHAPDDPFQALGVKCVGVLGQLALHPAPADLNRDVGAFLVGLLRDLPDTPAADAVEAFNQLFDVYGNEEFPYDAEVFWKDGFLAQLDATVPKARALAKSVNKTAQPELRTRADEVVLNLTRFLEYKRKHEPFSLAKRGGRQQQS